MKSRFDRRIRRPPRRGSLRSFQDVLEVRSGRVRPEMRAKEDVFLMILQHGI